MIVFVGASASGKTELAKILFNKYGYQKCITTTTREIRANEKQDIDYHFISKETFLEMQLHDEFVEVTHYQDHLYGIQKKDVVLNGVVIVDPAGANALIDKINQEAFVVYVETNENLRELRMILRGDEESKIKKRLVYDHLIFKPEMIKRIDLTIRNDEHSLDELANFIHKTYQSYLKQINI